MYQLKLFWKHTANTFYTRLQLLLLRLLFVWGTIYKYYFLFWLLLKCLLYKNCMILNHFDFWYDGMIFKESTIFLWREKKEKKFYGLWSMARVVKRTTFLWILSKGPFWRERYILLCHHHHNIKANCNLHRAIFHLL